VPCPAGTRQNLLLQKTLKTKTCRRPSPRGHSTCSASSQLPAPSSRLPAPSSQLPASSFRLNRRSTSASARRAGARSR
jgi:hypothetical protein